MCNIDYVYYILHVYHYMFYITVYIILYWVGQKVPLSFV